MKPSSFNLFFAAVIALGASGCTAPTQAQGKTITVQAGAVGGDGSTAKPFGAASDALQIAKPGDTIILREGVYREQLIVPSGAEGATLTIKGEGRALVSGMKTIGGWKAGANGIFTTTLDWKPEEFYVGFKRQPMARFPNTGWATMESVAGSATTGLQIAAKTELNGVPSTPGGHLQVFQRKGIVFFSLPVENHDAASGVLTLAKSEKTFLAPAAGDNFLLKNRPDLIDRAGEWAVVSSADGASHTIHFKPQAEADLQSTQAPDIAGRVISVRKANNVRLEGLEIAGGRDNGLEINNAQNVVVERCIAHSNSRSGFSARFVRDIRIARSLSLHNDIGISIASARGVAIEENQIGYNLGDGLTVGGDISGKYGKPGADPELTTENVTIRRNYFHHHMLWRHPDNVQFYRGVKNIKLEENFSIGGGQGLMTEEVDGGEMSGNVFMSSGANLVLFGHKNSNDWKIRNNTFLFPGYNIFSFTGKNYDARESVFAGAIQTSGETNYSGDRNIFTDDRKTRLKAEGQDAASVQADPLLKSVPKAHGVIDFKGRHTASSLTLRGGADGFAVGDTIEVNWDGVARKINAIEGAIISFAPALPVAPFSVFGVVANWGEKTDLQLDTRLSPKSPAIALGEGGKPVGSSIDIAGFENGDFDADGKRDIPELPSDVKAGLPNPNDLMPPSF